MSLGKRYAMNVLATYAATAVAIAITFVYTPFLIKILGKDRYGVWVMTISVAQTAVFFDLGFVHAARRFLSSAIAKGDTGELREVFTTAHHVYLVQGTLALLCCLSGVFWLAPVLGIPTGLVSEFRYVMVAVAVFVALNFWKCPYVGVAFGANRIDLENLATTVQKIAAAVTGVALLYSGAGLTGQGWAVACSGIFSYLVASWSVKRLFPGLRSDWRKWKSRFLRPMLGFSAHAMIQAVSWIVMMQAPTMLCGAMLSPEAAGKLSIPMLLVGTLGQVGGPIATSMFPLASNLNARDEGLLRDLYVRGSRLCFLIALSVAVPLVVFAEPFIRAWVGGEFAWTWSVLAILAASEVVRLGMGPAWHVLTATRSIKWLSLTQPVRAVLLVGLTILILKTTSLGLAGIAIVIVALTVPFEGGFLAAYTCLQLHQGLRQYFWRAFSGPVVVGLLTTLACVALRYYWDPQRLIFVVLYIAAGVGLSVLLGVFLALDVTDRRRIWSLLPWRHADRREESP